MKHHRASLAGALSTRAVLAALAAFGAAPLAFAQAPAAEQAQAVIAFDIPEQSLAASLTDYARQSGVTVLFPYAELAQIQAPALRGRYRPAEAIDLLLARSGWRANAERSGAIRLVEQDHPQRRAAADEAVATSNAQAVSERPADTSSEEIVVTGTRIRGAPPAGANVITLDRDYIEESGQSTLAGVLQTLPQNFAGSQNEGTQNNTTIPGRNIAFASTVDLRGLGADATLTLVNGRRLAPAGFGNFVDVSAIPLAAVDHVEILPDGASAIYGSDAVGGVVNIILRSDFDAQELALRYGDVTKQNQSSSQRVTRAIAAALTRGVRPWVRPWRTDPASSVLPRRSNGAPYRGVNAITLWATAEEKGFGSSLWLTFKQAEALGGHIRAGEHGAYVVYYKPADRAQRHENDEPEAKTSSRALLRGYIVFNASQIEGLEEDAAPALPALGFEDIAVRFAKIDAKIRTGGDRAYYALATDHIQLPPMVAFIDAGQYFATLGHELGHWTRHPSRLDRDFSAKRFGDAGYALEELTAELCAAFLGAALGLPNEHVEDHASYIGAWLAVLQDNPSAFLTTAAKAQAAADYLLRLMGEVPLETPSRG